VERPRESTLAWFGLGVGILAYDWLAPEHETMSEGYWDALERPVGRYFAIGALALTAAHLLKVYQRLDIPNADPFHWVASLKP
jgi:hypothetical protein